MARIRGERAFIPPHNSSNAITERVHDVAIHGVHDVMRSCVHEVVIHGTRSRETICQRSYEIQCPRCTDIPHSIHPQVLPDTTFKQDVIMPTKIDSALRQRAVRLVLEHQQKYPSMTAAVKAVAGQVGMGHETLRKLVRQAEVDAGHWPGFTSEEHAEIKKLKAENRRLREDVAILQAATTYLAWGELRPPQPMIARFIDDTRAQGYTAGGDLPGLARARPTDRCTHLPGLEAKGPARRRANHH